MKTKEKQLFKRVKHFLFAFLMLGILGINCLQNPVEVLAGGKMTVHFLDIGQGLSIFVQSEGQNLIYDGGDRDDSSFVISYLKKHKVSTIDYLISSHYDSDHLAGLIGCLSSFQVKNVISSDYEHGTKLYQSFIDTVNAKGLSMQHPAVGTEFSFGSGSFEILAPAYIKDGESNDNSVAIKLCNGDNSFIFTGDAEHSSEGDMCASGIDLSCDVLVPGHHGSATATSWEFLEATIPGYAVISCGEGNSYGHPHKDTMDKLEAMEIEVFRTDLQGTVIAESDGSNLNWNVEPCNDYSPGDETDEGTVPDTDYEASVDFENEIATTEYIADEAVDAPAAGNEAMVWKSESGSKYHSINNCGRMNPSKATQITQSQAEAQGLEACSKCY